MPIKKDNCQRSIVISKDIAEKLKEEAKKSCCSESSVVRRCITQYFRDKEKKENAPKGR